LVEHNLAKVGVASSSLVSRSKFKNLRLSSDSLFSLCHGLCQGPQHHGALPGDLFRLLQEQPQPRRGVVPGDVLDLVGEKHLSAILGDIGRCGSRSECMAKVMPWDW
jgi:hypothetical protein